MSSNNYKGKKNSQYGTMWITDGENSTKIKRGDKIPFGWVAGRALKNKPKTDHLNTKESREKREKTLLKRYGTTNTFELNHVKDKLDEYYKKYYDSEDKKDFNDLNQAAKRRRILKEQNNQCLWCGLNDWQGKSITLELDHINGNKSDNGRDNLRFLCPNCHSQTPTFRNNKRT